MRAFNVALIAVFIAIGTVACSSDDEETVESQLSAAVSATPTPAPTPLSTESPSPPPTPIATGFDYLMVDIAAEAPGFAGMLIDPVDNNILLVKTTQPDTDGSVYKAAIISRFPEMSSKTTFCL